LTLYLLSQPSNELGPFVFIEKLRIWVKVESMKFKFIAKDKVIQLPKTSGVYAFKKGVKLLYIGKAVNLRERVKSHFLWPHSMWEQTLLRQGFGGRVGFIKTNSEIEALILEANLIKKYQPKYNVVWRDDKNYFYVGVTKEDFPRVFWTHQTKVKSQNSKVKSIFVGPFVDGRALKQTLKVLRKIFPYRTCKALPKRPCLWHQLQRCPAPCLTKLKVAKEINLEKKLKKECKANAKNLMKILQGKRVRVLKNLRKEMKATSNSRNFEMAVKIRDQISALEKIMAHAKIFQPEVIVKFRRSPEFDDSWRGIEKDLKKILRIKNKISRIEAYDVSNIQGQEATGSMVTFINGLPDKNFYRKFKIGVAGKPNDIAMLKECLIRRIRHQEWPYPDLILIDGGIGQLNAAIKIKDSRLKIKDIKVTALAKKENKLYIEGKREPMLLKNLPREIFNLILQLRDEAHRFARAYHLKLRTKVLLEK